MTPLITDEQRTQLLANGRRSTEEAGFDPPPVAKLFTPDAGATWLLTEIDPEDEDRAFGLCDLGLGCPELGWASVSEIEALRGPLGLPVERDLYFRADKPLSGYARDARLAGRIVT
ncbi:MAG: transposase [Variovorax paradoxus]|uniref:Transposase n=1 Tax=Variovorax paradoxus TaxID=34073 RepID=A0A2W5STQ7_VARPD|nr:MAG: transposase [Variovorax paradoxus]